MIRLISNVISITMIFVLLLIGLSLLASKKYMAEDAIDEDSGGGVSVIRQIGVADVGIKEILDVHGERDFVLLDVRERSQHAISYIEGSLNIPLQELSVRAPIEIEPGKHIIIDCGYAPACESISRSRGIFTPCTLAAHIILNEVGFGRVSIFASSFEENLKAGVEYKSKHRYQIM